MAQRGVVQVDGPAPAAAAEGPAGLRGRSRHGSFAQGADELGVTPSAVSHQIQQLEAFLGVSLFQRHAGRAVLTSAGRTYAREIEHAMGVISEATTLVAPQSQDQARLVIAWGVPLRRQVAAAAPARWFLRAPIPACRCACRRSPALTTSRDPTGFDIAITYGLPSTGQRHVEAAAWWNSLRPLCSPALAAAIDPPRRPANLRSSHAYSLGDALCRRCGFRQSGAASRQPSNELWLDRSTMAIEAAVDGLGVVLESEILAAEEIRDGRLVAPFGEHTHTRSTTSYFLVRSPRFRGGPGIAAFETWLRAAIATANLTIRT